MGQAKQKKRRQQQEAGRCYLCGGTGLTKQHVWPDWASPNLMAPEDTRYRTNYKTTPVDAGNGRVALEIEETDKARPGQLNQLKYRKFCGACNTVWMRKVEEAARPFAEPLMKGEPCVLDSTAQEVLARWLTLVLIVVESGDPDGGSLPQAVVRKFHNDGQPLSYGRFFLAPLDGKDWICRLRYRTFKLNENRNNTQTTTMGMGKLLVYMFSTELPERNLSFGNVTNMVQIWPITVNSIAWPLAKVWNDAEAEKLAHMFYSLVIRRAPPALP